MHPDRRHAVPRLPVAQRELPDRVDLLADITHVYRDPLLRGGGSMKTIKVLVNGREEEVRVVECSTVRDPCCMDSGVDTDAIDESCYEVHNDLWCAAVPSEIGMLCVGCLERRLGRQLKHDDFSRLALSAFEKGMPVSERLRDRMSTKIKWRRAPPRPRWTYSPTSRMCVEVGC
jgi:hypothetical protein